MLEQLLSRLARRPRVVALTLHNTRHILDIDAAERAACVAAMASIARVVVHSVVDLNRLKMLGLVNNVVMIPHGANTPTSSPNDAGKPRVLGAADAPLIGCYGFFLPGKGIANLIGGIAILRKTWPKLRLRLVNAEYAHDESALEIMACRAAAEAVGLGDAIDWFTEFLPDDRSRALLAECDMIVLPYEPSYESASGSLRIALSAGSPVIVTPIPLFDEAQDAVLRFSGTSSADIATGLAAALLSPTLRDGAMQAAVAWMDTYSWVKIAERTQGMLLGLALESCQPAGDATGLF